jgi:hypothetical protein
MQAWSKRSSVYKADHMPTVIRGVKLTEVGQNGLSVYNADHMQQLFVG